METQGKISVAMTTYNGEKYIEKQLSSIVNQNHAIDELIICDDGSTDRTVEIIEKVIAPLEKKMDVLLIKNDKNKGYIQNFYQALSNAHGAYIFLADQDDIWEPDKVGRMMKTFRKTGAKVIASSFSLINAEDEQIDDWENYQIDSFIIKTKGKLRRIRFGKLVFGNCFPGCTIAVTSDTVSEYLRINNEEVPHDFQLLLIGAALGNAVFLNEKLIRYRLHGNNTIGFSRVKRENLLTVRKIRKKPMMVQFLESLHESVKVKGYCLYLILYYGRIPFLLAVIKRLVLGR